jgi:hypothetical protein
MVYKLLLVEAQRLQCGWQTATTRLTSGESSTSISTGVQALHNFAVESIPYVTNAGRVGCGITPLQVE